MRSLLFLFLFSQLYLDTFTEALAFETLKSRSKARVLVDDRLLSAVGLSDEGLGQALDSLKKTTATDDIVFDTKAVAGKWRVVHAPHLAFLAKFTLTEFDPIEYYLTKDCKMAASVRYKSNIFGEGWLNTAGYYKVEDSTSNVIIVWDTTWWNNARMDHPTPPEEGYLAGLIQSLGDVGFLEPLSFFPIQYVDDSLAIFNFFGFTITAKRFDKSPEGLYVSAP